MGRANRDNRWLLIFQLVFDESGLGQNHAFVFAGFLGPLRAWEQFADLWEPLLKRRQQLTAKGFKRMVSPAT